METTHVRRFCVSLAISLLSVVQGISAAEPSPIRIAESEEGFLFTEGSAKILFFQRKPKSHEGKHTRADYVHPLYDLDGNVLTEDFPKDHLHHRGIFWAWHQIRVGDKSVGDPWSIRNFSWDVQDVKIVPTDTPAAAIRALVLWKSPLWTDAQGKQKPLVRETTEIRVYPVSSTRVEGDTRIIDFQISLLALEKDLHIGGSNDDKGYGGFSTRIRLPGDIHFLGANGEIEPQRLSVEAGAWLDMTATFGKTKRKSGLTVLCHPTLPGFPQRWILRRKGSMQNPVYPGRHAAGLSTEKPLVLRYRLIVHRDQVEPKILQQWQKQYAEAK